MFKGPEKSGGRLHDAPGSLVRALRSLEALQRAASRPGRRWCPAIDDVGRSALELGDGRRCRVGSHVRIGIPHGHDKVWVRRETHSVALQTVTWAARYLFMM
jgi:hypothetical protein